MKKFFTTLGILLVTATIGLSAGFVADINLSWNENPANEFVTKYIVYQAKLPSTTFVAVVTATGTNVAKVRVTSAGTYQFKVSAVNGVGESAMSQMVQIPNIAPTVPTGIAISSVTISNTP